MRFPVTVVAALLVVLGLPRDASPVPGPPANALDAELAFRALALEGDGTPGAGRRRGAVAKAIRARARDAMSAAARLRTLRSVARDLGRAFGEDPVLESLLHLEVDGIADGLAAERDDLGRYLGDLADSPESDAGRAALSRAEERRERSDRAEGVRSRCRLLARVSLALGSGWRVAGSLGGRLTMEINGGKFVSDWFEAAAVPSGEEGAWRLEMTATWGRTTGAGFQISFEVEGVTGPGEGGLFGPGRVIFRDYQLGAGTGKEYTTSGSRLGGSRLVLTVFDPERGIVEGTFGMTVKRTENSTYSHYHLTDGEFSGVLRIR